MSDILLPKEQEGGADIDFWRELLENDQPYGLLPKPPAPATEKARRPTVRLVVKQ